MSLRRVCLFATLAAVVAFAAVEGSHVRTRESDVLTPNSGPPQPALVLDESLWNIDRPASKLVRSGRVFDTASDPPILPVQSTNPKDLAAGKLLVASRDLGDPDFAETVVLLVRCDARGVVGLILNRRTNVPLSRVFEQLKAAKDRSDPVYLGGPVETPAVFALLRSATKLDGAEQIVGGVYFISTKDLFEKAISARPDAGVFHVYLGYAGWGYAQLRKEVELGAWFIFQADNRTVFDSDPDSLWRQMIQKTELKLAGNLPAN